MALPQNVKQLAGSGLMPGTPGNREFTFSLQPPLSLLFSVSLSLSHKHTQICIYTQFVHQIQISLLTLCVLLLGCILCLIETKRKIVRNIIDWFAHIMNWFGSVCFLLFWNLSFSFYINVIIKQLPICLC